jgi:hypothetical protein
MESALLNLLRKTVVTSFTNRNYFAVPKRTFSSNGITNPLPWHHVMGDFSRSNYGRIFAGAKPASAFKLHLQSSPAFPPLSPVEESFMLLLHLSLQQYAGGGTVKRAGCTTAISACRS